MQNISNQLLEMKYELRQSIKRQLWRRGWKNGDLAAAANLYPSDFSNFMNVNGTRTFPIDAIDTITETFGLPIGEYYPLYFGECYNKDKIIKHRFEEFLYRCKVNHFHQLSEQILSAIVTEKNSHLDVVFVVANRLFEEKKLEEALPLIELIIEHDPNRSAQRLATCYFYRFFIVRDKSMEQGYQALVQMLEYITYMPHDVQLEAYMRIITFFYAREDWQFVWEYGKKLEHLAKEGKYYGEALLYQSFVAKAWGKIEEALEITSKYEQVNDYYKTLAIGNRMHISIYAGKTEYIDEFLSWMETKKERHVNLPYLLEVFVKWGELARVEPLLTRFKKEVEVLEAKENPHVTNLLMRFRYFHAIYLFLIGNIEKAIEETIEAAHLANQLGNLERCKDCLWLYWQYRENATVFQKEKYDDIFHQLASSHRNK